MMTAGIGHAYTYTEEFVPGTSDEYNGTTNSSYFTHSVWTNELGYAPVSAGANSNTGYVGVYASAWIGTSAAEATQAVEFELLYRSTIEAEVTIIYAGDTINFGAGSFSGSAWLWQLNGEKRIRNYISHPLSWDIVLSKVLDIVLSLVGAKAADDIADAIEVAELIRAC